jgi:hypothetical protein
MRAGLSESKLSAAMLRDEFILPPPSMNGHVNNVVFVQWMQDVATAF